GTSPMASNAPRADRSSSPTAVRGAGASAGTTSTGTPDGSARARSSPPAQTATIRHPRASASSKQDTVSTVLPENDEQTTSVPVEQCSRSAKSFTTPIANGRPYRDRALITSPPTPV